MRRQLLLLSFIEGAAVMAAELCGAKLMAPVYGSSLYVWASVMGITLAALAGGYFFGGYISERPGNLHKRLFIVLIAASLFLLLMPVITFYIIPVLSHVSFLPAVVLSTLFLLFLPVFFLGATSPLFIRLQTNHAGFAGKASGTVYAVSTFGGILATFLCGFWMIPELGLTYTMLIFGSLLFISTFLLMKVFKVPPTLLMILFVYLNLQFILKQKNILMSSDSILGHLEVEDIQSDEGLVRQLKINQIVQSEMALSDKKSVSQYIQLLDSVIPLSDCEYALVLGLGGGLSANMLVKKGYRVSGVEFDQRIIDAAKKYFFMNELVKSTCDDARHYINHCKDSFDLIVVDLFKAEEQPSHVLTIESLEQVKRMLRKNGTLLIGWHGYTSEKLGAGTAILKNTLKKSGFNSDMISWTSEEDYRNLIFVCSEERKQWARLEKFLIMDKLQKTNLLNTDNQPVLEKYNARANKAWRKNYLSYYRSL